MKRPALALSLSLLTACGPATTRGMHVADGGLFPGDAAATADAGAPDAAAPVCTETITVPVRVHLLASASTSLRATWSAAQASERLTAAAAFWAGYCLQVDEESVVTTTAEAAGEAAFASATASAPIDSLRLRDALRDTVPRAALLASGWNVFVIHDFNAPTVGVFIPDPGVQSVFVAQQRIDGTPLAPFILAHELGHALSLEHYSGADRERNLMRDDPHRLVEPVELTPAQAAAASAQAASGSPPSR